MLSELKPHSQRGVTLIIALIMVIIIGLTSAAAMRGATSSEKVVNNIRMQNLAQQYAEAALRYCESQLLLADGSRPSTLQNANITVTTSLAPAWNTSTTWSVTPTLVTTVPSGQITSSNSAFAPSQLPQCLAERQALGSGTVTLITARGFSPDYQRDSSTQFTVQGAVVWLQSMLTF